jgi:hypothetical protein
MTMRMLMIIRVAYLSTFFCLVQFSQIHAQSDVLTQHNDAARTGWNQTEKLLNVSNVNQASFALLTSFTVDDQIYSQPLIVNAVNINNGGVPHNIVYVTTVNNSIYAFDADNGTVPKYWSVNLTTGTNRPPNNTDMHACGFSYNDFYSLNNQAPFHGKIGIVGTPVIDKSSNTLYVVSRDMNPGIADQGPHRNSEDFISAGFYQWFHAIDIRTGLEKVGSPVLITATTPGTAPGSKNGILNFDSRRENQRGGLLLMNGLIYIPYASHCDWNNYNGWILAYDAVTLEQKMAYVSTPNDGRGGIWMSGGGIAGDPDANGGNGSIYFSTGNSNYADPSVLSNRGESIVKLNPNGFGSAASAFSIADYFTPFNYTSLNDQDLDFGTQVMLVPNSNLLLAGCKDHNLYVFDKNNLGRFDVNANHNLQKIYTSDNAQMHASFGYFGGTTHKYFYQFSENTNLKAYPVNMNSLGTAVNGVSNGPVGASGSLMSTSSNGSDESTGILWISHAKPSCNANNNSCPGILRAVDASNISNELWNSEMNASDNVGGFSKNACPTIANGKVYLSTLSNKLNVYGLLASNPRCTINAALNKQATDNATNGGNAGLAFDGNTNTSWTSSGNASSYLEVDLGASYDICRISIHWDNLNETAKDFIIQGADSSSGPWTNIKTVTNNIELSNEFDGTFTCRYFRMQGVSFGSMLDYHIQEMSVLGQLSNACTKPANLRIGSVSQNAAEISWNTVPGAISYALKYKTPGIDSWISRTTNNLTQAIPALTCGLDYTVEVQSVCSATLSSSFSTATLTTGGCITQCTLPTRYNHADIGDIGFAGSSCLNGNIFTIKGSGKNIGRNDDEFQFAFTNLAGDENYAANLISQNNYSSNKSGIMIRDSLNNTSRFAYIAFTSGAGAQFIYRNTPAGSVGTLQGPVVSLPYKMQLKKIGSVYTAYVSPTGFDGSWIEVGSQDLGFGTGTVYSGLAVTSSDNSKLATATFDTYEQSVPLPITLVSFSAINVHNEYVSIKWTTSMEQNNDYFLVEHSTDGLHFETLSTVKSSGNSIVNQDYIIADNHPAAGLNYYRIKQYDSDGKTSLYPVAIVKFGGGTAPTAFPNPVSSVLNVSSGEEIIQSIGLYDLLGKEILVTNNSNSNAVVKLKMISLSSGVYILKITTPSKVYEQKIMKE